MTLVSQGVLKEVWFGFDEKRFLLRVDTEGPARERLAEVDQLRAGFVEPSEAKILVDAPVSAQANCDASKGEGKGGEWANAGGGDRLDPCSVALPFDQIGREPGETVRFFVELFQGENSIDRAPREGLFELFVPSEDFERIMWQV